MQEENKKKRFAGKGYYIALIACIAAVGISGYVFVKTARDSAVETSAAATISPAAGAQASASEKTSASPSASATANPAVSAAADKMEDAYEETMGDADIPNAIQWPLEGQVLSSFSRDTLTYSKTMADWRTHEGLDIAAVQGTPVSAVQSGTVTAVYEDDFLGSVVVVSHEGDLSTLYANLAENPGVTVGESVSAGQVIGQVGNTALLETAEEDHLHFEVFSEGISIDPLNYLPQS